MFGRTTGESMVGKSNGGGGGGGRNQLHFE